MSDRMMGCGLGGAGARPGLLLYDALVPKKMIPKSARDPGSVQP